MDNTDNTTQKTNYQDRIHKKQIKKLKQQLNNAHKQLTQIFSSWSGFIPFAGPIKNTIEAIVGNDLLTAKPIQGLERGLRAGSSLTRLGGYTAPIYTLLNNDDPNLLKAGIIYTSLQTLSYGLYATSLMAGGSKKRHDNHIAQSFIKRFRLKRITNHTNHQNNEHSSP